MESRTLSVGLCRTLGNPSRPVTGAYDYLKSAVSWAQSLNVKASLYVALR